MSATDTPMATSPGSRSYEDISKDWKAANLRPLWESALAHKAREGGPAPHHWKWKVLRPLIDDAMTVTNPVAVERRVLTLTDPDGGRRRRQQPPPISPPDSRSCCPARRRDRTATP